MSLENRIIKRWRAWWVYKNNEPSERIMKNLVNLALEEVQRDLVDQLTTQEAIAIEHALSTLNDVFGKSSSLSNTEKLVLLQSVISPKMKTALEKIQTHLQRVNNES
jgi:hypothetical protein